MTVCQLLSVFLNESLNYYLLVFMNNVDGSELERLWRNELFLMLTTSHVVFSVIVVSVDKLEAVPLSCVE